MKRTLSAKVEGYILEVDDFDDWLEALADIGLGRIKIGIAEAAGLDWPFDVTAGMTFSSTSVTSKEQIVCALLSKYPTGLSKTSLCDATRMNPDSLTTYLTSKQMGIADGLEKKDEEYSIKSSWLISAVAIAREALRKCSPTARTEPQGKGSGST